MVGLHTADTFSRVVARSQWCHYCLWVFCLVLHVLNSICSSCEACCSLLSICQALSLSFFSILLPPWGPPTVAILPICSFTYLLLFLALGWWQSGIWVVCLLFHDMLCCVTAAAWSLSLFLLLLHPGSQQTLTYVSASHVLISNLTMLLTLISSSPELFVTLLDTPKHPLPLPQTFVSLSNQLYSTTPPVLHGRTSWDRSTARSERSWAHLPAAWRNLSGECDLWPAPKCPPVTHSSHFQYVHYHHVLKSQLVEICGRFLHVFDFY